MKMFAEKQETFCFDLPLSYSWVESLPVTILYSVVVVEVLLLVLLHRGRGYRLFGGKNVCCHLLLLLAPQSDYLITDWGQLGAATGISFLWALTWFAFHWLRKHQEESQTFHVPSLGIDHECVQLLSSGIASREDIHQEQAGVMEDLSCTAAQQSDPVGGLNYQDISLLPVSLLWSIRLKVVIWRDYSSVKFDLLTERLSGFPSLLVQSDEISSSDHFFSPLLPCLSHSLGCPDSSRFSIAAVELRQRRLFRSFHSALLLPLCFSSPLCLSSSVVAPFSL